MHVLYVCVNCVCMYVCEACVYNYDDEVLVCVWTRAVYMHYILGVYIWVFACLYIVFMHVSMSIHIHVCMHE